MSEETIPTWQKTRDELDEEEIRIFWKYKGEIYHYGAILSDLRLEHRRDTKSKCAWLVRETMLKLVSMILKIMQSSEYIDYLDCDNFGDDPYEVRIPELYGEFSEEYDKRRIERFKTGKVKFNSKEEELEYFHKIGYGSIEKEPNILKRFKELQKELE